MSFSEDERWSLELLPKPVNLETVKNPFEGISRDKYMDPEEWDRKLKEEEEKEEKEEAKRTRWIKKATGEIPWWESDPEDEEDVKPAPTYEELKDVLKTCTAQLHFIRDDRMLMRGSHNLSEYRIESWEPEINHLTWRCWNWTSNNCIPGRGSKHKILSNEQKKDVIASLKGWVVQDDFDTTVSRFPQNIRHNILAKFAAMIILKDCLTLFFSNPFWYLGTGDEFSNSESFEAETPFGAQLNTLYNMLQKGETPPTCDFVTELKANMLFLL
jgi:hypothetical protein